MSKVNKDGLCACEILNIKGCPITLPRARSMTQAALDFKQREDNLFDWYEKNKHKIKDGVFII